MNGAEHALEVRSLRKVFGDIVAIDDLTMSVDKGTIYGLIGPNGSGKTTTIKVLMGLMRPTSGSAKLLGEELPLKHKSTLISYMPQELALYLDLTVSENMELFAKIYGVEKETFEIRKKGLLEMVDLTHRKDNLVGQLSGGMQHRTSLACAMVNDPELVFLDEPTVGVDPELREGFWTYFANLKKKGKTIILTTHYMDEASRCDTVGMMHKGRLLAEGLPEELVKTGGGKGLEEAFLNMIRRSAR
jgi:ABC-2 type transport system ATP-binding protein